MPRQKKKNVRKGWGGLVFAWKQLPLQEIKYLIWPVHCCWEEWRSKCPSPLIKIISSKKSVWIIVLKALRKLAFKLQYPWNQGMGRDGVGQNNFTQNHISDTTLAWKSSSISELQLLAVIKKNKNNTHTKAQKPNILTNFLPKKPKSIFVCCLNIICTGMALHRVHACEHAKETKHLFLILFFPSFLNSQQMHMRKRWSLQTLYNNPTAAWRVVAMEMALLALASST